MADKRKSGEAPRGPLAEGAERLERLARHLKDSQLARTRSRVGAQPPVSEAFVLSPDEAWAKKYMSHCIGPVCFPASGADVPAFSKLSAKSAASGAHPRVQTSALAPRPAGQTTAVRGSSAPIGAAIGKPARRTSWLGRLLRGR